MTDDKLNGSVDLLAKGLHVVFTDAVVAAVEPPATQFKAARTEMRDLEADVQRSRLT